MNNYGFNYLFYYLWSFYDIIMALCYFRLFKYYNGYRQLAASSAAAAPAIEIEACAIRKTIQQPVLAALDLNEAEFCDCTDEETALIQEARASLKLGGTPDPPDPLDDRLASALRQSLEKSTSVEEG